MMEMAKVTSKGQITIPISIRRKLGINEGDKILFINKEDGVLIVNPDTFQGDLSEETVADKPKSAKKKDKAPVKKAPAAAAIAPPQPAEPAPAVAPPVAPAVAPQAHTEEPSPTYTEASVTEELVYEEENPQGGYAPIEYAADVDDTADNYLSATANTAPIAFDESDEKSDIHAGGVNLSTLLDDIRSIGSKI